jgi:outer membrane beta-barrel protein
MENWHQRVLLSAALSLGCAMSGHAQEQHDASEVINPDIERRDIASPDIDTEDFEVGPFIGILSIADFDSDVVYGLRAAWHVTEDFFFEASYGASKGDQTSYEKLSGGAPLFADSDRDYTYYNMNLGWNALPGEVFIGNSRALKSDFYFIAGVGSTDFLGDNWFTVSVGAGYRLLLNDSFALRMDLRDHLFDRDVFGEDETTNNIEWSFGLTYFF